MAHEDSSCDISAMEAVKIDDIDESAVRSEATRAASALASAADGSVEAATAQIELETARAMGRAIGVTV